MTRIDTMLRTLDPGVMITAIVACFDPLSGKVTWTRAGHPPPLLCTADDAHFLEEGPGTPLGTLRCDYTTASIALPRGALLVLYTDGLVERRGHSIDEGLSWIAHEVVARRGDDPDAICRALLEGAAAGGRTEDDMCVLALRTAAS
jgi:serine phosphatase RsbU (regulator of sigma subunit)